MLKIGFLSFYLIIGIDYLKVWFKFVLSINSLKNQTQCKQ